MAIAEESVYDREKAKFDVNNRVMTLSRPEGFQHVIDGNTYMNSHQEIILSATTDYHSFVTPSADVATIALSFAVASDLGPMVVKMWEGATLSALGTIEASYNLNRNSLAAAMSVFTSVPTITNNGTQIWTRMVSGGKDGAVGSANMVMYLKPDTVYLFSLENKANQDSEYSMELVFTEM